MLSHHAYTLDTYSGLEGKSHPWLYISVKGISQQSDWHTIFIFYFILQLIMTKIDVESKFSFLEVNNKISAHCLASRLHLLSPLSTHIECTTKRQRELCIYLGALSAPCIPIWYRAHSGSYLRYVHRIYLHGTVLIVGVTYKTVEEIHAETAHGNVAWFVAFSICWIICY